MSAPSTTPASATATQKPCPFELYVKPLLRPYYFAVAGALGAVSLILTVVIVLMILVGSNFNVLGWTE